MNILIVDDDLLIRNWLSMLINQVDSYSITIFEATDGIEAIEFCNKENINLVITDIKMPRMDGLELIRYLEKEKPEIHTAVLSSYDDFSYVRTMLKSGALDYILKAEMKFEDIKDLLSKISNYSQNETSAKIDNKLVKQKRELFHNFLNTSMSNDEFFKKLDLNLNDKNVNVSVFKTNSIPQSNNDIFDIIQTCNQILLRQGDLGFCLDLSPTIYSIFYVYDSDTKNKQKEICSKTLAVVDKNLQKKHNMQLKNSVTFSFVELVNLKEKLQNAHKHMSEDQRQYSPPIESAITYIHENFGQRLVLEDIAVEVFLNKCYLSQLFKKEVGVTFNDYLEQLRVNRAKQLLLNTTLSISQIAEKCGFTNQNYFAKVFKQVTGFSPLKFKQY